MLNYLLLLKIYASSFAKKIHVSYYKFASKYTCRRYECLQSFYIFCMFIAFICSEIIKTLQAVRQNAEAYNETAQLLCYGISKTIFLAKFALL